MCVCRAARGVMRRRMRRVRRRGLPARARSAPMKSDLRTWLLRSTIGAVDSARATSSLLRRSYHPEASVLGLRPRRRPLPPAVAARGHSLRPLYGSRARRPSRAYRTRAALPAFVSAACTEPTARKPATLVASSVGAGLRGASRGSLGGAISYTPQHAGERRPRASTG